MQAFRVNQSTAPASSAPETWRATSPAPKHLIGLWLSCASLAFLLCLYGFSATLVDGVFIPADHDSFYHARRIIAALGQPFDLLQFDAGIHAPEGSWVTWPWAYDTMMAVFGTALVPLFGAEQPMTVLAFVAPVWVFVNSALLMLIGRRLDLQVPLLGLALLCFALSPLTRILHRVGMLDHHFVELSFVLAGLWLGLRWFANLRHRAAATWCAVLLGAAPAFHNGLFILQLPVLITLFVIWAMGRELPRTTIATFSIGLIVTTAVFLLPSETFLDGQFSFYVHSGFHLYIACASALTSIVLTYLPRRLLSVAVLGVLAIALAWPILNQIAHGSSFLRADIINYKGIPEVQSVLRVILDGNFDEINKRYSGLFWLLPLTLGMLLWQLGRYRDNADLFFVVMCGFGVVLLAAQFRLQYFGSFTLYLAWCVVAQRWISSHPEQARKIATMMVATAALSYIVPLRALNETHPAGGSIDYMVTHEVYPVLREVCAKAPGVVLAELGDGHHITYHSSCSVTANMFIMTPQHQRKVLENNALFRASVDEVLTRAPYLRYILVRRADNIFDTKSCYPQCPQNVGLRHELLSASALHSSRVSLLFEKRIDRGNMQEPLLRLFAVNPEPDAGAHQP